MIHRFAIIESVGTGGLEHVGTSYLKYRTDHFISFYPNTKKEVQPLIGQ